MSGDDDRTAPALPDEPVPLAQPVVRRPTVLVVGSGFAGLKVTEHLERLLPADAAEIVLATPTGVMVYTPLLPQVAAGILEPRHIAIANRAVLGRTRIRLAHVRSVDLAARTATLLHQNGDTATISFDRLVLAPGAQTRTLDIPGLAEHGRGLKNLAEAIYVRDHVLRELERANDTDDLDERRARLTFVVVGAGYTGTEVAAQLMRTTRRAAARLPRLDPADVRWVLCDQADRVLPGLSESLGRKAATVLKRRGVEVRLGISVERVEADRVVLAGETVRCHTVVWAAGVTPSPLMATLGLPTEEGRLVVDACLRAPQDEHVFALGDAAAAPDLTKPKGTLTGQTAQHAIRQAPVAARNVAASLGHGTARPYKHHDLGFVVDLGGLSAVADPLHLTLSGLPAAAVTRGYHLLSIPSIGSRLRVTSDWLLDGILPRQLAPLSVQSAGDATIAQAESTQIYG
jgi:NADH:ubiquinone reductase (H+-translocating)